MHASQKPHLARPAGVSPALLMTPVTTQRSSSVIVHLLGSWLYREGLRLSIEVQFVGEARGLGLADEVMPNMSSELPSDIREGGLVFSVGYTDGRRAMVSAAIDDEPQYEGPLFVTPEGGSGSPTRWELNYWASPPPENGPVYVGVSWTRRSLEPGEFVLTDEVVSDGRAPLGG
jgi:hypothetical protein